MLSRVQHQSEGVKFLRRVVEGSLVSPILLLGPEGVGRRFSVLSAVREAFCEGTREPSCECSTCFQLGKGIHTDVFIHEAADRDIGIDEVRSIVVEAKNYPSADFRCFIIDGADRFTGPAANAFLKTLEEPPARSRFFLLAESADLVLPTIRSRCGAVRYNLLPEAFVLSELLQRIGSDDDSGKALIYARMGEGSVGRAVRYWGSGRIGLRDQVIKVLQLSLERDLPALFALVDSMEQDLPLALKLLEQVLHDVLIVRVDPRRAINTDRVDELATMHDKATVTLWSVLSRKVKALQNHYRTTRLNLQFQVKTILVESF